MTGPEVQIRIGGSKRAKWRQLEEVFVGVNHTAGPKEVAYVGGWDEAGKKYTVLLDQNQSLALYKRLKSYFEGKA